MNVLGRVGVRGLSAADEDTRSSWTVEGERPAGARRLRVTNPVDENIVVVVVMEREVVVGRDCSGRQTTISREVDIDEEAARGRNPRCDEDGVYKDSDDGGCGQ